VLLLLLLRCSAYGDKHCLSPQLLASFTEHLEERGSREVLLDVFSNSTGPLPQDLLPLNTVVSNQEEGEKQESVIIRKDTQRRQTCSVVLSCEL
jgi:hypothetical protein